MYRLIVSFSFALGFLSGQNATSQSTDQTPKLSAREVFYNVLDEPVKPTRPKSSLKPASKPVLTAGKAAIPRDPRRENGSLATGGSGGQITRVLNAQFPPLGLKYSLFRVPDSGNPVGVEPDYVFHTNDHMRLRVEANSPGYIYVIARGASGRWSTLFPAKDGDKNYLVAGEKYYIPKLSRIIFTDPPGKDRLFVYFSRQPVHSNEDLMLELSKGSNGPVSSPVQKVEGEGEMVQALNRIDDNAVAALTALYSRDLIVETAPSASPESSSAPDSDSEGTSVYLVDKSGSADSHVVADITFTHE